MVDSTRRSRLSAQTFSAWIAKSSAKFSGELATPSYWRSTSLLLKLPRTLSTRKACELWLTLRRNVLLARKKPVVSGCTTQTTSGRSSSCLNADSESNVLLAPRVLVTAEKRTAASLPTWTERRRVKSNARAVAAAISSLPDERFPSR
jgi:hypothetical protein